VSEGRRGANCRSLRLVVASVCGLNACGYWSILGVGYFTSLSSVKMSCGELELKSLDISTVIS